MLSLSAGNVKATSLFLSRVKAPSLFLSGVKAHAPVSSVVEPEPPFLAGAVKKGAAPAPAQGPAMTPCLKKR